jgi:uncharacterized protein YgbK (DUF1537 family)
MIAVIADDLTGAAELAGIGLNFQLRTEINTVVDVHSKADLLIIATDTRSLPVAEARQIMADLTRQLMQLNPQLIFKKIDSVLRGHVLDEVNSQLIASGLKRALIVPGNPLHGKQVINGIYYYNNQPVHLSNYAHDPGFPLSSSDVKKMLRTDAPIHLLKKHEDLPDDGIVVGEIEMEDDFNHWVQKLDQDTLIAGAAGLFNSLLQHLQPKASGVAPADKQLRHPRLFVFGSTFKKSNHHIKHGWLHNVPVLYIPNEIIFNGDDAAYQTEIYCNDVASQLKLTGNCIMAVQPDAGKHQKIDPYALTKKMGLMVNRINNQITLHELLIEGGATATAILQQMEITQLHPVKQIAPGVICTSIPGNSQLSVTLKPGSYNWPSAVWEPTN